MEDSQAVYEMRMKRGVIFLLPILVALGIFAELQARSPHQAASRRKHQFVKTLGSCYKVFVTQVDEQPADGAYWGAFEDIPNTNVDDLTIT